MTPAPVGGAFALTIALCTCACSASLLNSTQIRAASAWTASASSMLRSVWYFSMSAGPDAEELILLMPRTLTDSPDDSLRTWTWGCEAPQPARIRMGGRSLQTVRSIWSTSNRSSIRLRNYLHLHAGCCFRRPAHRLEPDRRPAHTLGADEPRRVHARHVRGGRAP